MDISMKARIHSESEQLEHLNGQEVFITRGITEPDERFDLEVLPVFEVLDRDGHKHTVFGDEVRTADGSHNPDMIRTPIYLINGRPVTDTHPFVVHCVFSVA